MAKTFTVERSATIRAPASVLYALVADFHAWTRWSPWEGKDPNMARTYEGAPMGTGAVYHWVGNKDVGSGRMEITSAVKDERIDIALAFLKPWKAENETVFRFDEANGATTVTWTMTGKQNFVMKIVGLFMNMDKMIGDDFEKGLKQLDAAATAG